MKKRKIFTFIIIFGTLLQFVLANVVFNDFPGFLSYVLLVPFYLFVYLYYQRYKYIKYICFISIFTVMANLFMLDYLSMFPLWSNKIRLIGMVSFFGSLINNLLLFILILQPEPRGKLIKSLFAIIVLSNYFFFSYYLFPLTNILIAFFGPDEQAISTTLISVQVITYILQFVIMIAQVVIVQTLDREDEYYLKAKKKY